MRQVADSGPAALDFGIDCRALRRQYPRQIHRRRAGTERLGETFVLEHDDEDMPDGRRRDGRGRGERAGEEQGGEEKGVRGHA